MTHTGPMPDSDGDFNEWKGAPGVTCRECDAPPPSVKYRIWSSHCGGYDDHQFMCEACGYRWWVEGPDA